MISGLPVGCGVGIVEQSHRLYASLAHIEHEREQFVGIDVGACGLGHGVFDDRIHIVVLESEIGGVAGVGCHAFAAIYGELLQPAYIGVFIGEHTGEWLVFHGLLRLGIKLHMWEIGKCDVLLFGCAGKNVFQLECTTDEIVERRVVEVGIGDGGEQ